jgi:hypothetical protein
MRRTPALRDGSQNELRRKVIRRSSAAFIRHSSPVSKTSVFGTLRQTPQIPGVYAWDGVPKAVPKSKAQKLNPVESYGTAAPRSDRSRAVLHIKGILRSWTSAYAFLRARLRLAAGPARRPRHAPTLRHELVHRAGAVQVGEGERGRPGGGTAH